MSDASLDVEQTLAGLSLEDKVRLLAGADNWHTHELPGVPKMRCSDGPAGVRGTSWQGPPSASFPCGTALGATFDPDLVREIGEALGREARSKGAHVLLAPTVNLHRTPIGGRNFECMSEDPVLTAHLADAYVRGLQSSGVAACIKHLVGNDTEHERMTISSEIDERTLREMYLLPFEAACRPADEGGADAWSMMTAYNRLNGEFCSEHPWLLRDVVRNEWAWDGVLFSDWFGTHSAAPSLEAGLDLEMPGPARERGDRLLADVRAGVVSTARVDESARRLLTLFARTGVGSIDVTERTDDSPATRTLIRRAGAAATVLMKNDAALLPLDPSTRIALVGPYARTGQVQGGGSARVRANHPVAILHALTERFAEVEHSPGCSIAKRLPALRGEFDVDYRSGDATATEHVQRLSFAWMDDPAPGIAVSHFGARISGTFTPDSSGTWQFGMSVVGPAVLRVDGEVVVDLSVPRTGGAFFGNGSTEVIGEVDLEAGHPVTIDVDCAVVEMATLRGLIVGAAGPSVDDPIIDAERIAATADVAVVVVGTDADWETEGEDRTTMDLPGRQNELVRRLAAVNQRTIVIVNAGSPVTMPWYDDVAAVMQIWFPGQEIGHVVADVLSGDVEPGGRLPITMPMALADTPAFEHHPGVGGRAEYAEGQFIGYRWYDRTQRCVRAPFGAGLGYTTWHTGDAKVSGTIADGVTVAVEMTNTGHRTGSQVVQIYVQPPSGDPARPLRSLAGFAKVTVDPGDTAIAEVWLPERRFSVWDVERHEWVVPPGAYTVHMGTSSADTVPVGQVVAAD